MNDILFTYWIIFLKLNLYARLYLVTCNPELSEGGFNYWKSSMLAIAIYMLLLMHEKIQSWLSLFGFLITSELKIPKGSVRKPNQKLVLVLLLILLNIKLKHKAESTTHASKKDVPLQCSVLKDIWPILREDKSRKSFNLIWAAASFWRFLSHLCQLCLKQLKRA